MGPRPRSSLCLVAVLATAVALAPPPQGTAAQATAVPELAYLDTPGNVWLSDANGENQRKLLNAGRCGAPWGRLAWSPAGDRLACLRRVGPGEEDQAVVLDLAGRVVQETRVRDVFAWSPTGRHLVYGGTAAPRAGKRLHAFVVTDTEVRIIARLDTDRWSIHGPVAWSPDGSAIAYPAARHRGGLYDLATGRRRILSTRVDLVLMWVRGGQALLIGTNFRFDWGMGSYLYEAYLLDLERGTMTRMSVLDDNTQTWRSPDGRRLALSLKHEGIGILDLHTLKITRVEGSSLSYPAEAVPGGHVAFSADSSTIYWADTNHNQRRGLIIYRSRIAGGGHVRVATHPRAFIGAFSSDLQYLAYYTAERQPLAALSDDVWTARLDGSQARRIGHHPEGIQDFAWRPRSSR